MANVWAIETLEPGEINPKSRPEQRGFLMESNAEMFGQVNSQLF